MDQVIDRLNYAFDNQLYLVGGALRDRLTRRPTKDIDMITVLLPDKIVSVLKANGWKPILIGKKFGTIFTMIDEYEVQISTFRSESYSEGSRKPCVTYTADILLDLSRRDFTMNAIASDSNGKVQDPFGGTEDIHNKIIRAVGNDPNARFTEDPLRMLRAIRFVSELGFKIEDRTLASLNDASNSIMNISKERITQEMDRLLSGHYYDDAVRLLASTNLFMYLFPELYLATKLSGANYLRQSENGQMNSTEYINLDSRWSWFLSESLGGRLATNDAELMTQLLSRIALFYKWPKAKSVAVEKLLAFDESKRI